jgi:F0F1-type ATP synthase gamma subunit
MPVDW